MCGDGWGCGDGWKIRWCCGLRLRARGGGARVLTISSDLGARVWERGRGSGGVSFHPAFESFDEAHLSLCDRVLVSPTEFCGALHQSIHLDGVDDGQGFAHLELLRRVEGKGDVRVSDAEGAVLDWYDGKLEVAAGYACYVHDGGQIQCFLKLDFITGSERGGHGAELLSRCRADNFDEHLRVVDGLGEDDQSFGDEIGFGEGVSLDDDEAAVEIGNGAREIFVVSDIVTEQLGIFVIELQGSHLREAIESFLC